MPACKIICVVGRAGDTFEIPFSFRDTPSFIKDHFNNGSKGVIDIEIENQLNKNTFYSENREEVEAVDLHDLARQLTNNEPYSQRVNRIALILANKYKANPRTFGIMFDRGMATDDDPYRNPLFTSTPREACAIFLGAIKELRPNLTEFLQEVEFTTIHELGHIFNLGHVKSPINFMTSSNSQRPYDTEYFKFIEKHQKWLMECDSNPNVYPGGSKFFPVNSSNKSMDYSRHSSKPELYFHIGLAKNTFPSLHPVELDVELKIKPGKRKRVFVADRLDPGYEEFKIWIISENGEKRLFRSFRNYFAPLSKILIDKKHSFHRDISLFEGANGRTFCRPGLYTIQAEFNLHGDRILKSNILKIEVLPDRQVMPEECVKLFSNQRVRRFLYHRSSKYDNSIIRTLEKHLTIYPHGEGSTDIRYAIARANALNFSSLNNKAKKHILEHLYIARDKSNEICKRQQYHVNRLLETIKDF
jgi:hypothetical protein